MNGKKDIYWGWFVVVGAFLILSVNYGSRYCFGIFVKPMALEYGWSRSVISTAASINIFIYAVGGILSGRLLDRMAPKWIMTIGGVITAVAFMLAGFVRTPWQFYLVYGVLCGAGMAGIGVVVSSSYVGKWFIKKRGVALGITTIGIGFGTMVLTPLAGYVVKNYDWQTGFMFLGVVVLSVVIFIPQLMMGRTKPEDCGLLPDGEETVKLASNLTGVEDIPSLSMTPVLTDSRFWIITICYTLAIMAEMLAFVHQVPHALENNIGKVIAASSLGIIGAASIFGRFFFGWLSDRMKDAKYSASLGFLFMAAGMLILWKMTTVEHLLLYGLIFGFGYGSLAPMMPILLADRFDRHVLGSAYGVLTFFAAGVGGGLGPIIGGMIYDKFGSYIYAWQFNLLVLLIVTFFVLTLKPRAK
jgi:OFA family oxalate/formate antiporter-like MFS transporter